MSIVLPAFGSSIAAFSYLIALDGTEYVLRFRWLERAKAWYLDVLEADGETELAVGIRVVVTWNLFFRHATADLPPGALLPVDISGEDVDPLSQAELGDERGGRVRLVYLAEAEVEALPVAPSSSGVVKVVIL